MTVVAFPRSLTDAQLRQRLRAEGERVSALAAFYDERGTYGEAIANMMRRDLLRCSLDLFTTRAAMLDAIERLTEWKSTHAAI